MNKKKVVIIDYKLGNLFSVKQACDDVGLNSSISSNKDIILDADALILPGVGAFSEAMKNLNNFGLSELIKIKLKSNTPLFGICLGLQLLFTKSEEFGNHNGLNIINGIIKKFPKKNKNKKIKVPHVGWNTIYKSKMNWGLTPINNLKNHDYMYFVHSFYVKPNDNSCILTKTNYEGLEFCSSIKKSNIFACQFHPEKSGKHGIDIYKNWAVNHKLI